MSGKPIPTTAEAKRVAMVEKRRASYHKAMARSVKVLHAIVREKVARGSK